MTPRTELTIAQIAAQERIAQGVISLLDKERGVLNGAALLQGVLVGAAAAAEAVRAPGQNESARIRLANVLGCEFTKLVIEMGAEDSANDTSSSSVH